MLLFFFLTLLCHHLLLYLLHVTIFNPEFHSHIPNLSLESEPELNPFRHQWRKLNPVSERRISSSSVPESLAFPPHCPSTGSVSKAPFGHPHQISLSTPVLDFHQINLSPRFSWFQINSGTFLLSNIIDHFFS